MHYLHDAAFAGRHGLNYLDEEAQPELVPSTHRNHGLPFSNADIRFPFHPYYLCELIAAKT
jgi:hypothetical protein